jgi:hypothetical protein
MAQVRVCTFPVISHKCFLNAVSGPDSELEEKKILSRITLISSARHS